MIHTTRTPRARHSVRHHLVAVAALAGGLVLLSMSGAALPAPPSEPTAWLEWWSTTDPALALGAVLRLISIGLSAYLLLVTTLDLIGVAIGLRPLSRLARRLAPSAWRAVVLRPVAAGTLAVPTLFAPALTAMPVMAQEVEAPESIAGEPITLTMTWGGSTEDPPESTTTTAPTSPTVTPDPTPPTPIPPASVPPTSVPPTSVEPTEATATATPIDALPVAPPVSPAATASPEETADHLDAPPLSHPGDAHVHVVRPGDSFWRIAEERVAADIGRAPHANEVRVYWRALINANEDRLPVPGNPDVIYPGAELRLPDLRQTG